MERAKRIGVGVVLALLALVAAAALVVSTLGDGLSGGEIIAMKGDRGPPRLVLDTEDVGARAPALGRLLDEAASEGRATMGSTRNIHPTLDYLNAAAIAQGGRSLASFNNTVSWKETPLLVLYAPK